MVVGWKLHGVKLELNICPQSKVKLQWMQSFVRNRKRAVQVATGGVYLISVVRSMSDEAMLRLTRRYQRQRTVAVELMLCYCGRTIACDAAAIVAESVYVCMQSVFHDRMSSHCGEQVAYCSSRQAEHNVNKMAV